MKPNFENCILNVTASIMKRFKTSSNYKANELVFNKIANSKHVFLVILDGLGKNIIEKNLPENSFIRKNILDWITSVYPPTTVAATTAALSGLTPGETGWIGWHQYFKEIDEDVVLFKNTTFPDNKPLSINVSKSYIGYLPFYKFFKNVKTKELYPSFKEDGFETFSKMGEEIVKISLTDDETYTYCYWNNPDYLIHEYGISDFLVNEYIKLLDSNLSSIYESLGPDSSMIVIADHGLIDTTDLYLTDYPEILDCLVRKPTIESRTISFEVNDKMKFERLFNQYFGNCFKLYSRNDFLKEGYLGLNYEKALPYLGDYIAIAIDKYCLLYEKGDMTFKANHAGGCVDEMIVPLIVLTK